MEQTSPAAAKPVMDIKPPAQSEPVTPVAVAPKEPEDDRDHVQPSSQAEQSRESAKKPARQTPHKQPIIRSGATIAAIVATVIVTLGIAVLITTAYIKTANTL